MVFKILINLSGFAASLYSIIKLHSNVIYIPRISLIQTIFDAYFALGQNKVSHNGKSNPE